MTDDERDRAAEAFLVALHDRTWYIGDATAAEWRRAYATVDAYNAYTDTMP